jgi:HSP20 family protein
MFDRSLWNEFDEVRRSFDRVFDNFSSATRRGGTEAGTASFVPAVETGWTDDYLNLRFVVPGVTEKDLKLSVQGNQLTLEGERRAPENFGTEGSVYRQVNYGKFERVIDLPNGLDTEHMQAHLHEGFLDVRIPLAQAMKPKQIQISSGGDRKTLAAA